MLNIMTPMMRKSRKREPGPCNQCQSSAKLGCKKSHALGHADTRHTRLHANEGNATNPAQQEAKG